MKKLLWLLKWMLKAAIFFTLFAFALNNQHEASIRWFFGHQWRAPMTLVVLVAFGTGLIVGVLGMLPGWWSRRQGRKPPADPDTGAPPLDSSLPEPPHGV